MSKRQSKCLLSREEILRFKKEGKSIREIAILAGVTKPCIQYYLNPEPFVRRAREFYQDLDSEKREAYIEEQKRLARNSQKLSLILKPKQAKGGIGWTTHELEYLQENIKTKTLLEIAIDLKRTFHSVKHAAQRYGISSR